MVKMTYACVSAALALALGTASASAQACGAATDTAAILLRVQMRQLAGSTAQEDGWERRDAQIPHGVDTTTIAVVTQNATCQKALAAFNATIPDVSPLPTKVYLVKVGTVYVAMHPLPGKHWWPYAVLDSKYKVLSTFVQ